MSRRLGISWGLNQEQQQVGQEPKTSSTADEEICNNKEQNKGSVCKLSTINDRVFKLRIVFFLVCYQEYFYKVWFYTLSTDRMKMNSFNFFM